MVVCQLCDETFHAQCHSPALMRKPVGKWLCYRCTIDKALAVGCKTVVYPDAPPLTIDLPKGIIDMKHLRNNVFFWSLS